MNTMLNLKSIVSENSIPEVSLPEMSRVKKLLISLQPVLLFLFLLAIWFPMHGWLRKIDPTAAVTDESIWLQIILGLLSFLIITALCAWLIKLFWLKAGLPSKFSMVSQFKQLTIWQQLVFYWASYALLLLAASICLAAIC